jgi:dihydroneopterin aldolase
LFKKKLKFSKNMGVYRREKKKAHRTTLDLDTQYYNRSKDKVRPRTGHDGPEGE